MLEGDFFRDRLGLPVEELPLPVDVQPATGLIMLIALDAGAFVLPLIASGFTPQSGFEGTVVPSVLDLFGGEAWRLRFLWFGF